MAGKSSRNKGGGGEREVATWLNELIYATMLKLDYNAFQIEERMPIVQRNQNQTAVGGCDLIGTFGLAIEVKRQEALNVSGWWKQAKGQAPPGYLPVLMYRQNRDHWKVMTYAWSAMPTGEGSAFVVTISKATFGKWFQEWVEYQLTNAPQGVWPA